jgi:hypothetical protein
MLQFSVQQSPNKGAQVGVGYSYHSRMVWFFFYVDFKFNKIDCKI